MKQPDTTKILFSIGGGLSLLGAFMKLFDITYAQYVFSVGTTLLIYIQVKYTFETRKAEVRERRLARNGLFSTLLLGIAAYFMFVGSNSWVVAVLIYALSALFLSFRGKQ